MSSAIDLADGDPRLIAAIRRSRKLLNRRALVAACASAVPVPGLDWAVDAALISNVIPRINAEFGLSAKQLDQLNPHKRAQVQKAVALVGSLLIGKFLTHDLILTAVRRIGLRMTAAQVAKFVPLAGQAVAAVTGYVALRYLGEEHMKDCVRVVREAQLLSLPAPQTAHMTAAMAV